MGTKDKEFIMIGKLTTATPLRFFLRFQDKSMKYFVWWLLSAGPRMIVIFISFGKCVFLFQSNQTRICISALCFSCKIEASPILFGLL